MKTYGKSPVDSAKEQTIPVISIDTNDPKKLKKLAKEFKKEINREEIRKKKREAWLIVKRMFETPKFAKKPIEKFKKEVKKIIKDTRKRITKKKEVKR